MGITYKFSAAEIGAIVHALQSIYPEDSPEIQYIANPLCRAVFDKLGSEFFDMWVDEFDLNTFVSEVISNDF